MIESVLTVGGIVAFIVLVLSIILVNTTSKASHSAYLPSFFCVVTGLGFLIVATFRNVGFLGAPLGGVGIALLFSAAIGLVITSIFDAYRNANA